MMHNEAHMIMSRVTWWIAGCMVVSLMAHLFLFTTLNIVEDESAYMQDAAQISSSFLPFREFGGTKGPLYLFSLHGWQNIFGRSIEATRLSSVFWHLFTIPLLGVLARRFVSPVAVYPAVLLWAVAPVVVSLTTNVTHIPFELGWIFLTLIFLTSPMPHKWLISLAALTYLAAVMSRATAVAFGPLCLYLLLVPADRWRRFSQFAGTFLVALGVLLAIIYPLYGWPKTAFFFNADAVLIARGQQVAYQAQQVVTLSQALYAASQPVWLDSFPLIALALVGAALLLPRRVRSLGVALALVAMWYGASQLNLFGGNVASQLVLFLSIRFVLLILISWLLLRLFMEEQGWASTSIWNLRWIVVCWIGAFYAFYKGWGRSPTPFYPLESIGALVLLASVAMIVAWNNRRTRVLAMVISGCMLIEALLSFSLIPTTQYRGTVEVQAAKAMAAIISERVPEGDMIFTAQPVFPYLANRSLLGGYTHPGWYLSERAGYMPRAIRHMFLPDLPDLLEEVRTSVNWIVVDWRTEDVYFKGGVAETEPFRTLLEDDYREVARVKNPASRDVILYERIK